MIAKDLPAFLEALCRIDSRTVSGSTGTTRVSEMLAERLRPMGFEVEWVDPPAEEGPRGRHLRAVRNAGAPTRVVLMGHGDTVLSPEDAPFRLDAAAQRAFGSGVTDMKGGCVLLVEAVRRALETHASARDAGLTVLLNCAEEVFSPSFRALAQAAASGAAACLNFEPASPGPNGEHQIAVARKGVVRFELTCHGRSAHAGSDHALGVNAIRELARKIERIECLTDPPRGVTANVGFIRGGRVCNQVADEATAHFEVRAFDAEAIESTVAAVRRLCAEPSVRSVADGAPARLELKERRSYPPWPRNPATDRLAQRYAVLAQAHGITVVPKERGGASDASYVSDLAPTLDGLGILGADIHSPREWADLATLPARIATAAALIAELCARPRG